MPLHVPVRSAAALLALAAAVTGCTTPHSTPATKPRPATSARPASPSPTPSPTASDGRNLKACADGNCEVLVTHPRDIAVGGHGGVDEVSVDKITDGDVELSISSGGSGGMSGIGVGCTATFYTSGNSSGTSGSCPEGGAASPPEKIRGVLSVQLVSASKVSAILRLASGPEGEPPSSIKPDIDVPTLEPPDMPDFGEVRERGEPGAS